MTEWILTAYDAVNRSLGFMLWNTFLALIPWVISLWIFRGRGTGRRRVSWWIGLAAFIVFLPNAPYVLTDIIHLVRFIREDAAIWTIALIWLPQYLLFMLIGSEAYVLSLINLGHYLKKQGLHRHWAIAAELSLHALCALGIYLGRVPRFNSWDVVTHPGHIGAFVMQNVLRPQPLAAMVATGGVIAVMYWLLKHMSLALALYWQTGRAGRMADHRGGLS